MNLNIFSRLLLKPTRSALQAPASIQATGAVALPNVMQTRGFKHKDVLQLRCDSCYFTKMDERWYVLCTKFPRHKQVERVERNKFRYIVSERCTVGYPPFKKRYQFHGHILS